MTLTRRSTCGLDKRCNQWLSIFLAKETLFSSYVGIIPYLEAAGVISMDIPILDLSLKEHRVRNYRKENGNTCLVRESLHLLQQIRMILIICVDDLKIISKKKNDHISGRLITWDDQHDHREFSQYLVKKLSSCIVLQPRKWFAKRDKQLKERHELQNITTLSDYVQDHTAKYREKCYELPDKKN